MRHFRGVPTLIQNPKYKFPSTLPTNNPTRQNPSTKYKNPTNTVTSTHQKGHTLKQGHASYQLNEAFAIRLKYHNQVPNSTI